MSHSSGNCPCNPAREKMQAITAILNPDTVDRKTAAGKDVEQKMMLFQSLPNRTLGYDQFEVDNGDQIKAQEEGRVKGYYGNPAGLSVPVLKYQSKLASMKVDNTVRVYGVIDNGTVCMLSPVFEPLNDCQAENGIIAGCSNGVDESHIFFQKNGKLWERSLAKHKATATAIAETENARPNTDIIAFFDGKRRWIAYQLKDDEDEGTIGNVIVRCLGTTKSNTIEDSGRIAGGYTKLAAVFANTTEGNRIYLYLTTAGNRRLYRAYSNVPKEGGLNFNQPSSLGDAFSVADYTWFDVEADAKTQESLIYTIAKGDTEIKCVRDSWSLEK